VFCGDFLEKGKGSLDAAYSLLEDNLFAKVKAKKVVVTCGNHDVDRTAAAPMFIGHLEKNLTTDDEICDFVQKDVAGQFSSNLEHIKNYNEVVSSRIKPHSANALYYTDMFESDGKNIGILSLNTAWSSITDKKEDYGNIKYPTDLIRSATKELADCDTKILISHYPISYILEGQRSNINSTLFKNYICVLSGHAHTTIQSTQYFSSEGIFSCSAPACLTSRGSETVGYLLLDFDIAKMTVKVDESRKVDGFFADLHAKDIKLPVDEAKKDAISFATVVATKLKLVLDNAGTRFSILDTQNIDFKSVFNTPIIKTTEKIRSVSQLPGTGTKSSTPDKHYTLAEIVESGNYVVHGETKSGKSMLLCRLQIELLETFEKRRTFPLYLDLKDVYRPERGDISIRTLLRREYGFSNRQVDSVLERYSVCLLLDNYQFGQAFVNGEIEATLKTTRFVLTTTRTALVNADRKIDSLAYINLYIHDLTRKQLRELTEKWPSVGNLDRDEVMHKVTSIFSQLHIPCSYWNVSLFLWIFQKTTNVNIHNNVGLIDLYVENLLERTRLAMELQRTFSFENFKDFLAEFAYYLYNDKDAHDYVASYKELVDVFSRFKENNPRIVADSRQVIDYTLEKGVIAQVSNDQYTFRLNGVFEYFLAHKLRSSDEFRSSILSTEARFLSFRNELEIYSGLVRNDKDLLVAVYFNVLRAFDAFWEKFPAYKSLPEWTDSTNSRADTQLKTFVSKASKAAKRLEASDRDELEDSLAPIDTINSAVVVKKKYEIANINSDMLLEHIHALGRVFRNMDNITDRPLVDEIFSFVLHGAMIVTRYAIEDAKAEQKQAPDKLKATMVEIMEKLSPVMSHAFLVDSMAHQNLELVASDHLSKAEKVPEADLETFLLSFLLLETDIKSRLDLVDKLIARFEKKIYFLHSIMIMLMYYLVFRCTEDKLATQVKARVLKINSIVNPNDSATVIQALDKFKLKQGLD
jgi:hypothetical protein